MSFWKNLFEQYQNYLEKTVEERRLLEQQNQQNQNGKKDIFEFSFYVFF